MPFCNIFSDMFILNWSQQHHYKCSHLNATWDTKKQTPILLMNIIIGLMTRYPAVFCHSWRVAGCSQKSRVPVDRYVTPIYVDLVLANLQGIQI